MFGLSFGKNKQTTKESATKVEDTTQSKTGTNTTNTSGTQNTSGSSTSNQSGSSTTTQGTTGTQTQTGTTTGFNQAALDAINGNIGEYISRILGGGAGAGAIEELGQFDAEAFINDAMAAATQSANSQFSDASLSAVNGIGGNAGENSMTALLQQRLANSRDASLAGARAQAGATAQQIGANRAQVITSAQAGDTNALAQVLNAVKGGESTTVNTGSSNQTNTGTTTSNQTGSQTQNQTTVTQQTVEQLINELLKGQTNSATTGVGSTQKSGGGLSLSL